MKLYNRLSRKIEAFTPLNPEKVTVYSCGPTVYDHAHIGNLSAYIFADTLRRVLALSGYKVHHAMNYTDIDDKTIRRSRERHPEDEPLEALRKLTDEYIALFLQDMQTIGNDTNALEFLRATDTIEEMKKLITQLHNQGFAYLADDGVYFSIQAYQNSGKTYGQLLEITTNNTSEARIYNDEYDKDSVHDFSLWKKQKEGEPAWEFTIGGQNMAGRPGWHIECSVMSRKALGQPFDIHTGGVDLIFPHHENEIAQSTACEPNPTMARFFAHNEHILVDGKKMAKSANNFYTLPDVSGKGFDPLAFRLLVLQGHYRNQVNFTWESLGAAQNRLTNLRAFADLRFQAREQASEGNYNTYQQRMQQALEDDLSTPKALEILSEAIDALTDGIAHHELKDFEAFLKFIDHALGLQLLATTDITNEQKALITQRHAARSAKDFTNADKLRAILESQGITVRDTPHGPIWARR